MDDGRRDAWIQGYKKGVTFHYGGRDGRYHPHPPLY